MAAQVLAVGSAQGVLSEVLTSTPTPGLARPTKLGKFSLRYTQAAEDENAMTELDAFAGAHLSPNETFIDLSNQPLLYVALDRKLPGYVVPMLFTDSEQTQRQLISRLSSAPIRFAILWSEGWTHDVDGVADAERNYRVLEYLHERFPAEVRVGRNELLVESNPVVLPPAMREVPPARGDNPTAHNLRIEPQGTEMAVTIKGNDPYVELPCREIEVAAGDHVVVELEIYSPNGGDHQIFIGAKGKPLTEARAPHFFVDAHPGFKRYQVLAPAFSTGDVVDRIRFDGPEPPATGSFTERVRNIRIGVSRWAAIPIDAKPQFDEIGALAWLWANRDPFGAREHAALELDLTPKVRAALHGGAVLPPHSSAHVVTGAIIAKAAQYVHLVVAAGAAPGSIALRYSMSSAEPSSGVGFDLRPGRQDYLVRPSGQSTWRAGRRIESLILENRSEQQVEIVALDVRAGD
jgi:hypothetical protein